jgi:alkanesulfonate monooxygenase SsuD/methylene tetrahydromethanopterin reductase-like flavin-dependent oxidoreductase (luciferase family)
MGVSPRHPKTHSMRFGIVILPQDSWRDARGTWQVAEEYGFDHAWTYDHLSWPTSRGGQPFRR